MFKEIVNTLIESSITFQKYQKILNNYAGYLSRTKSEHTRQQFLAELEEWKKDIFRDSPGLSTEELDILLNLYHKAKQTEVEEEAVKTSEDVFSKARYYAYIFADGRKTTTYGLYDWPHDKNYLDRMNMTIKDWLDEQVQWNDGCIGYELFDTDMHSLGIIKV